MKSFLSVLVFIALAAVSWGVYGPVLRAGQADMGGSHLRPFVCVGIAYFLIAILVPGILLTLKGERGRWTAEGTIWSLAAGAAGAIGALGIILAFTHHGSPLYVMPLVFGAAPVVNTFLTMYMSKTYQQAGPVFFAGLILVIAGAVAVLVFKPAAARPAAVAEASPTVDEEATETPANEADEPATASGRLSLADMTMITLFVALTALSWGIYGPVLHKGQMAMAGSRLRPFICVGISYFVIAVVVPILILATAGEHGGFSIGGTLWSLAGGAAGALGALGIIMAFNFGGKPVYVMPLVFGGAPVVNTLVTILTAGELERVSPMFYAGLITVVAGAVTVLVFAPKPAAPGHLPGERETAETQQEASKEEE
ncbi:MAG: hypothetical protein WD403_09360 [Pirellulales bacterium]